MPTRPTRQPIGRLAIALPLSFALAVALAGPATAEDPGASAAVDARTAEPSAEPTASPEPGASTEPSPSPDPGRSPDPYPGASPTAAPSPSPTPSPAPWPGRLNLFRSTAWVRQYTGYTCTAASVQTMTNIIRRSSNRTLDLQLRILRYERRHDSLAYGRGSDPKGWAAAMSYFSGTRYEWRAFDTRAGALRFAARRMALTRRPVGLLVWHGGHAWTMTGFTSATDPRTDPDAVITGIYVAPPLVGTDPRPNTYLRTSSLTDFSRYWERDGLLAWIGHWVVVVPR